MSHPRGGVSCVLVATRAGAVLFERFFPAQAPRGALAWRAALHAAAAPALPLARDEEEHVALHECVTWHCTAPWPAARAGNTRARPHARHALR
jgi:hypothetical protein